MTAYRLTCRGHAVFGCAAFISALGLGMFGGYIVATWFGLRG